MIRSWKEYREAVDEKIHRIYWIMLWEKWRRVPECIYNWCRTNLSKVKKWGVSSIRVNNPDEPKED